MAEAIQAGFVPPSPQFLTNVDYPVLRKLGKQNIRTFLRERAAYEREIVERKRQAGTSQGSPVSLVFSIEPTILESLVDLLQFGEDIQTTQDVTDDHVRSWLDARKEVKKDALSATQVHAIVKKSLKLNLSGKDAEQRIVMLFSDYAGLLKANGLAWVIKDHPKISIGHIVEAIRPEQLQQRLRDDL
jgi:hypothetical protein